MPRINRRRIKLWGLVSHQPRWGLTQRGWMAILLVLGFTLGTMLFQLQDFFAHTAPVEAEILVTEGWITDDALKGAIAEFNRKPYELLITSGSDLDRGELLAEYRDFAHLAEASLVALGFNPQKIQPVRTPIVKRDRTLNTAITVKQWLKKHQFGTSGINIYSENVHGRRSWLIYKKVFEPEIKVGVISHPAQTYDPDTWWTSTEGFKSVIGECISYIYIKFLGFLFK